MLLTNLEDQGLYLIFGLKPHTHTHTQKRTIGNSGFKDIAYEEIKDNNLQEANTKKGTLRMAPSYYPSETSQATEKETPVEPSSLHELRKWR